MCVPNENMLSEGRMKCGGRTSKSLESSPGRLAVHCVCDTLIRGVKVHVFVWFFRFGIHMYRTNTAFFNHCMSRNKFETHHFIYIY